MAGFIDPRTLLQPDNSETCYASVDAMDLLMAISVPVSDDSGFVPFDEESLFTTFINSSPQLPPQIEFPYDSTPLGHAVSLEATLSAELPCDAESLDIQMFLDELYLQENPCNAEQPEPQTSEPCATNDVQLSTESRDDTEPIESGPLLDAQQPQDCTSSSEAHSHEGISSVNNEGGEDITSTQASKQSDADSSKQNIEDTSQRERSGEHASELAGLKIHAHYLEDGLAVVDDDSFGRITRPKYVSHLGRFLIDIRADEVQTGDHVIVVGSVSRATGKKTQGQGLLDALGWKPYDNEGLGNKRKSRASRPIYSGHPQDADLKLLGII